MEISNLRVIIHAVIAAVGTIWFLLSYLKTRLPYQLLFVIWFPITLLVYLSSNIVYITVLGIIQLLLFIGVIYFLFRRQKTTMQEMQEQLEELGGEPAETPDDAPDHDDEIEL